jgi:hypothetical protein
MKPEMESFETLSSQLLGKAQWHHEKAQKGQSVSQLRQELVNS